MYFQQCLCHYQFLFMFNYVPKRLLQKNKNSSASFPDSLQKNFFAFVYLYIFSFVK